MLISYRVSGGRQVFGTALTLDGNKQPKKIPNLMSYLFNEMCTFSRGRLQIFILNLIKRRRAKRTGATSCVGADASDTIICVVIWRPEPLRWRLSWVHLPTCDSRLLTVKSHCALNALLEPTVATVTSVLTLQCLQLLQLRLNIHYLLFFSLSLSINCTFGSFLPVASEQICTT